MERESHIMETLVDSLEWSTTDAAETAVPVAQILLVDADPASAAAVIQILAEHDYCVHTARNGEEALRQATETQPDVVIVDLEMPGTDGLALLGELRTQTPDLQVVLATANGSLDAAVAGIKAGAFDFLGKPFVADELRLVIRRAVEHTHASPPGDLPPEQALDRHRFDNLVGRSPGMVAVYKTIARLTESESTVLLEGESGTGKELVARAIHDNSVRRDGPFVAVDGGALAETLLESELFGHERGAFTGAVAAKKGLLEKAQGGTFFLDEVANLSPALQSKLLRVIQEREIRRVGRTEMQTVDVRLIAASNKDLKGLVHAGRFREDLYYRLNVVTITIPPLREREDDIPLLAQFFARKYGQAHGKPEAQFAPEAMALLTEYGWPGNVRELEHVIERAAVLSPRSLILPTDLALELHPSEQILSDEDWRTLDEVERDYIFRVLEAHQYDQARAARLLGIHRKTLQRKLRMYHYQSPDNMVNDLSPDSNGTVFVA